MPDPEFDLIGNVHVAEPVFGIQVGQTVLQTHPESKCAGEYCCVHNPSDHLLNGAPLNWRADRYLMERICPHGVGHDDPDSLAYLLRTLGREKFNARGYGVHGCDGCCFNP